MINSNNSVIYQYYNNSNGEYNNNNNINNNNNNNINSISNTTSNAKIISNINLNASRKFNQVNSHSHSPVINNSFNQSTPTHTLTANPYNNQNNQICKKYHSPLSTLL